MRPRALAFVVLAVLGGMVVSGSAGQPPAQNAQPEYTVLSPGPSAARTPKTTAESDAMFQQISNWGRWGKDDQLGSVNLITAAKRKALLDSVTGKWTKEVDAACGPELAGKVRALFNQNAL